MAANLRRAATLMALLAVAWLASAPGIPTSTPSPTPSPTPRIGQVVLSPVAGQAGTGFTVTGAGFDPNRSITIYWDTPTRVLTTGTSDAQGGFSIPVTAPTDPTGQHLVCVLGPISSCATFTTEAAPTATPAPSSTPTPSPSSTASASPSGLASSNPSGGRGTGGDSALSALLRPPFVLVLFLILLVGVGGALYWIWLGRPRERGPALLSVDSRVSPGWAPAPRSIALPPRGPEPADSSTTPPPPGTPPRPAPPPRSRPLTYSPDEPPDLPEPGG